MLLNMIADIGVDGVAVILLEIKWSTAEVQGFHLSWKIWAKKFENFEHFTRLR